MLKHLILLVGQLSILVVIVTGYAHFQLEIPNGEHVPHPCKPNYIWHGVGHENHKGSGTRNPFGKDFENNDKKWDKVLCEMDSDGDGKTNGEELGDPSCKWKKLDVPEKTTGITHPGVCDPWDSAACKAKNDWIDCDPENDFKCDAFNEVGMLNKTIRFPATRVPNTETNYYCMVFDLELPDGGDFHMVGTTPHIDNKYVMHHMLMFGCDESQGPVTTPLNRPDSCGMGDRKCNTIIGMWTIGLDGECFHSDVGMRIGNGGYKKAMLQFHWNNPELRSDYVDSSGMNIYYTPNLRTYDASVLMIGQQYIQIPPRQERVEVVGTCSADCTKKDITGTIKVTRAFNHMHYMGREMKIEQYRNGVKIRDITNEEVYSYDSPGTFVFQTPIEIEPEDELKTTCVYKSTNKLTTTFYGDGTSAEMCFGFLTFHPQQSMGARICTSWKSVPTCKVWFRANEFPVIDDCQWHRFYVPNDTYTRDLYQGINEKCIPFGSCTPECLTEVKRLQNHPCIKSDFGDFLRNTAYNRQDMDSLTFYAGFDSCSAELALANQEPCNCDDCDRNINASGYVQCSVSLMLVAIFALFMF